MIFSVPFLLRCHGSSGARLGVRFAPKLNPKTRPFSPVFARRLLPDRPTGLRQRVRLVPTSWTLVQVGVW